MEVSFRHGSSETSDMLIAWLAQAGYEGFEEGEDTLKAYVTADQYEASGIQDLATDFGITFTATPMDSTNWNEIWESNFQPVTIDGFCAVRADFHSPVPGVTYDLLITPKMSFGTGHHATTFMMISQMEKINMRGKSVVDFGTGTGVLAILAEKMSARSVTAIDNDQWSIDNAAENIGKNNCAGIALSLGDRLPDNSRFDIILANITRNVILQHFESFKNSLLPDGVLLLSGILTEDEPIIMDVAGGSDFSFEKKIQRDNWLSLLFRK